MSIFEYAKPDSWIDIKSEDDTWRVSKVIKSHQDSLEIEYKDFPSGAKKISLNPKRVSPFRTHTSSALSNPTLSIKGKMPIKEIPLSLLRTLTSKLIQVVSVPFSSMSAFDIVQFIRGDLLFCIEDLQEAKFEDFQEGKEEIFEFFERVLDLIVKFLNEFLNLFEEFDDLIGNPKGFMNDSRRALASCFYDVLAMMQVVLGTGERGREWGLGVCLVEYFLGAGTAEAMQRVLQADLGDRCPVQFLDFVCFRMVKESLGTDAYEKLNESLTKAVKTRLQYLSEKDLKYLNIDTTKNLLLKDPEDSILQQENSELVLSIFIKLVKCPYLERRIKGLNEINKFINSQQLPPYKLSFILNSNDLLHEILEKRPHEELIKRSATFFKLMSENSYFSKNQCKIILNLIHTGNKKELEASYKILTEISGSIDSSLQLFIYKSILNLPKDLINLSSLSTFSLNSSNFSIISSLETFLLEILEDSSKFLNLQEIIKSLTLIYQDPQCTSLCIKFLESFPNRLESLFSVPQLIQIVSPILENFSKSQLVDYCTSYKLKRLLINNIIIYMTTEPKSLKFSHKDQLSTRFSLLELISVKTSYKISLRTSEISKLWDTFINSSKFDFSSFLLHLSPGRFKGPLVQDCSKVFINLFLDKDKFNVKSCSIREFKAFKQFFLKSNEGESLKLNEKGKFLFVTNEEILGLDEIILLYLTSRRDVYEKSKKLLYKIFTYFNENLEIEKIFFKNLEKMIQMIEIDEELMVKRALKFFTLLLDLDNEQEKNCKVYLCFEDENRKMYLPKNCLVKLMRKEISRVIGIPVNLVNFKIGDLIYSHLQDFNVVKLKKVKIIEFVFNDNGLVQVDTKELISISSGLNELIFTKLMKIAKYKEITWQFVKNLKPSQDFHMNLLELNQNIVFSLDPNKFLHSILIINTFIKSEQWLNAFKTSPVQEIILGLIIKFKQENDLILSQDQLIIDILPYLQVSSSNAEFLLKAVIKIIESFVKVFDDLEDKKQVIEKIEKVLNLFETSYKDLLIKVLNSEILNFFIKIRPNLIKSECSRSSFKLLETLLISFINISGQISSVFKLISESKVFEELNDGKCCRNFLGFLKNLVKNENLDIQIIQELSKTIQDFIQKTEESKTYNEFLDYLFKIQKTCIKKLKTFESKSTITDLFINYIQGQDKNPSHSKCKSLKTRLSSFRFFSALIQSSPSNHSELLSHLLNQVTSSSPPSKKPFNVAIPALAKPFKYLGLRNLSNTCYMNSLFQQLYFILPFRNSLLNLCKDSGITSNSTLFNLQEIFLKLGHLNKPFTSAYKFCMNFHDFEGKPVNIREQMDVDEFFCRVLDTLEEELKGTSGERLVRDLFSFTSAVEMISECGHRSIREELMISLPIEVKNQQSLNNSINSLTQGEKMQGENSYYCDQCCQKVSSCRRGSFKTLPNLLVLALRRFEFNYDLMQRNKIDDYFEFPSELDLKPYTTEFINNETLAGADYYNFQLKGVIMHYGKAEQGHYYSFIKLEDSWHEFNDSHVDTVTEAHVKSKAFGRKAGDDIAPCAYLLVYERSKVFAFADKTIVQEVRLKEMNLDSERFVNRKNEKIWNRKLVFSFEFLKFVIKGLENELLGLDFVIFYFVKVLVRLDRYDEEKFQVFRKIVEKLDRETGRKVLDLVCREEGVLEYFLTCEVLSVRELVKSLALRSAELLDKGSLGLYFADLLIFLENLRRFNFTSEYLQLLLNFVVLLPDYVPVLYLSGKVFKYLLASDPLASPSKISHRHSAVTISQNKSAALKFLSHFPLIAGDSSPSFLYSDCNSPGSLSSPPIGTSYDLLYNSPSTIRQLISSLSTGKSAKSLSQYIKKISLNDFCPSVQFISLLLQDIHSLSADCKQIYLTIITEILYNHDRQLEILTQVLPQILNLTPVDNAGEFEYFIEFLMKILYNKATGQAFKLLAQDQVDEFIQMVLDYVDQGYEGFDRVMMLLQKYPEIEQGDVLIQENELKDVVCVGSQVSFIEGKKKKKSTGTVVEIWGKEVVLVKTCLQGQEEKIIKIVEAELDLD